MNQSAAPCRKQEEMAATAIQRANRKQLQQHRDTEEKVVRSENSSGGDSGVLDSSHLCDASE